jgi:hypothetical protein
VTSYYVSTLQCFSVKLAAEANANHRYYGIEGSIGVVGRVEQGNIQVRFQGLTVVNMKTTVFWAVVPRGLGKLISAINSSEKYCN